ncbi:MAG TPA: Ig-like domain-containing protein [Vicinamibacteria bacterium]|nr:Ig-like domain-containing protein [Vicinamibacteria bacterium]
MALALTGATDGATFTVNGTARMAAIDGPILGGRGGALTTSFARFGDGGTGVAQSGRGPVEVTVPVEPPPPAAAIEGIASGTIRDGCTGAPMSGATVSLEKNEPLPGSNYVVPDPHDTIPTDNPEITSADGLYAWGVVPGRWRIRASKAGYEPVTVDPFDVPPPVTGLDVTLMPTGRCSTPPVANDDAYSTPQATILNVGAPGVLANDTDGEGAVLRAVLVTKTSHGVVALATDGSFNYTPNGSFYGGDSFTYKANDGRDDSNVATVSITVGKVNRPPIAKDDAYSTTKDRAFLISAPGVLVNDTDLEGLPLTAKLVQRAVHGFALLNANGSFFYLPAKEFVGKDTFTYTASNGRKESNLASVTIDVTPERGYNEQNGDRDNGYRYLGEGQVPPLAQAAAPAIAFVQRNYATPQTPASSVSVLFNGAQSAGNLNVVVVGWNDTTAQVSSVTDTKGNAYQLAVGPTAIAGALTQAIYYARNIAAAAAGANTVKVSFTVGAVYPDIRILEYGGMDPISPVDVKASATGSTTTSSTPAVVTTNASDLLFAANIVATWTTGAGTGWTSRVITSPDGDIAEDRVVSAVGSYKATAPLGSSGPWIMQLVAFKAISSAPPPAPTAPTNLAAAAAGTAQINLSWTNTSTSQTGVKIERSTDNVTFTQITVAGASAVSYSDTGLTASTTYFYRARATNSSGDSPYSNTASATTQSPPPTAPTNLAATAAGTAQINLSWTNTSTTQTGVKIERSIDNVTFTQITVAGATAASYSDTGLSASTTYFYRVRATSSSGDSPYSNTASATTQSPPPPTAPTNLAATAAGTAQINLSWTNTSASQTGVKVERSIDNVTFTQITVAGATAASYSDTGLSASTTYFYRVRATSSSGDSPYSNTASATTQSPPPPPTAPTNLAATAAGTAQINLSWTNTSTTQTGVKVERSTDNVTFTQITVAGATAATYSDTGLSASTTYFYRVRATSSSGDSAYSNTASAKTAQSGVPARPTLVQNLSTYTNRDVEVGNDFIINLANPTLANNCLILALTNAYSPTRTITVSDDKGNPWTTGPHTDFVANGETTTILYALGAAAGTQRITIHFDASIFNVHATVSEWYNIATTAAVNGSSAASDVASPVSPGAFTPGNNDANGGNLIYHHAIAIPGAGSLGNLASFVSAINVATGFSLASANRELASISQYTVQTTAAAINPTLTVGEADHFNTIAVAFKAAVAGTAPSAKGIRVQNMQHTFHPFSGSSTVNLPSSGNLLVLSAPVNTGQDEITSVTDSKGNAWTKVAGESPDSPQFWYAVNATPSNDLTISFDLANNTSLVVIAWDIIGAATAPFDKFSEATGAQILAGDDITSAPVITPTTANGLVIGLVNEYTGPPTSMIGAGYVADHVFYTGQTDASILDLGDGTAHIYNSDTSQLSFGWHQTTHPPTTGWFAIAVALKAAP